MFASEVARAVNAGNVGHAAQVSQLALREGFEHPTFLNLAAYRAMQDGEPREAMALLTRARAMAPGDMNILNAIGTCHAALGDLTAALRAYDAAIVGSPGLAPAYYNRGIARDTLGDFSVARADFERAVALRPAYPEALARLAYAAATRGDRSAARDYARQALAHGPAQPAAVMACAMADIADGRFAEVAAVLAAQLSEPHLSREDRAIFLSLLGDARDGAGDMAGSFQAYSEANDLLRFIHCQAIQAAAPESPRIQAARLAGHLAAAPARPSATAAMDPGRRPAPVFIVGFPRSGTTLIEQTLAGHPSVATSEERELLTDAVADFITPADGLARLENLSSEEVALYRAAYWERAGGMAPPDKLFIDKLPLNTVFLPIIAKIFPDAKIVFCRRDPRDVVFSCFRRRFAMNPQMYEFLTLEGATRYYGAVMHLAGVCRDRLGLAWKDVVYEDVVSDFEGEIGSLCAFLGLEWDGRMGEFAARLATRGVDTPSSAQLVKGLNRDGIGSWRRYREQMRPALDQLAPWVRRFGYRDE